MVKLAMVPEAQAVQGFAFKALIDPRCFSCNFYQVCSRSLRSGWSYEVRRLRRASHVCPILGERMYVVEVEELPLPVAVESKVAIVGLKLRYKRVACDEKGCRFRKACAQAPLQDGESVKVVKIVNRLDCPRELHLTLVELLPASEGS